MTFNTFFHSAIAALCGLAVAACSASDDFTEPQNTVQVEQAQTMFDAVGGTNTIVLRSGTGIQASVNAPWATATVSGLTVTVTADMNNSRESRSANVTLTAANGDQTVLTISQEGMIFVVRGGNIVATDDAQVKRVPVRHSLPVSIVSTPDWLSATVADGAISIAFDENDSGYIRSGYVRYQSGLAVDSFQVRQGELKDILGFYYLYFKSSPSQTGVHWVPAQITPGEILIEEGVERLAYTFDPETLSLHIQSGQLVETIDLDNGSYLYFYLSYLDTTGNAWSSYRDDVDASLTFDFRPDWGNYAYLGGKFGTFDIGGFTFRMFDAPSFDADHDTGQQMEYYTVRFLKWRKGTVSSDHPEVFAWDEFDFIVD